MLLKALKNRPLQIKSHHFALMAQLQLINEYVNPFNLSRITTKKIVGLKTSIKVRYALEKALFIARMDADDVFLVLAHGIGRQFLKTLD